MKKVIGGLVAPDVCHPFCVKWESGRPISGVCSDVSVITPNGTSHFCECAVPGGIGC